MGILAVRNLDDDPRCRSRVGAAPLAFGVFLTVHAKAVDIHKWLVTLEDDIARLHGLQLSQRVMPPYILCDCALPELLANVLTYLPQFLTPHGYCTVSPDPMCWVVSGSEMLQCCNLVIEIS